MKASMIISLSAAAAVSAQSGVPWTTSTVYSTNIYTVTSCAPTVTNCPVGHVTTDIISLYTTVCPVTATETTPPPYPTSIPSGEHTSTILTTEVITISSCAPTVPNCPYTTAPLTTTTVYPCPVETESGSAYPSGSVAPPPASQPGGVISSIPAPPSSPNYPTSAPAGPILSTITISTCVPTYITSVITVTPSSVPAGGVVPTYAPSGVLPSPPKNSTTPFIPANGAAAKSAGGLLMAVGIVAALL